jgi:ribosomal protein S12 methylthiotransferase
VFDSPEVDGEVLISKEISLKKGQFYQVEITGSEEFDLYGKLFVLEIKRVNA